MKALSVKQPWAGLIALGEKTLEVRSWKTSYRGPLVICSSQVPDRKFIEALKLEDMDMEHPLIQNGVALCVVDLIHVREGRKGDSKRAICDPTGFYVWVLANPRLVYKTPVKGRLSLFDVPAPRRVR
jgi:hypothetical protein